MNFHSILPLFRRSTLDSTLILLCSTPFCHCSAALSSRGGKSATATMALPGVKNGAAAFLLQLRRVTVDYCGYGGSSKHVRYAARRISAHVFNAAHDG